MGIKEKLEKGIGHLMEYSHETGRFRSKNIVPDTLDIITKNSISKRFF